MMSAPFKPLPIPPPSNADKAHQHIPSIDELVQDTTKVEALFQSYYDQATMLPGDAHNLRPIIVERFQRLLKILGDEHSSSSESNKETIHEALHSFLKSLDKVLSVSFSVQCDKSDRSGDDAMCDAFRPSPGSFSSTSKQIISNTHEPEQDQQISVKVGNLDERNRLDIDNTLLSQVQRLEDLVQQERHMRETAIADERRARESEVRILREALHPFYKSEEEMKCKLIEVEDRIEKTRDEQLRLKDKLIGFDDVNIALEKQLKEVEDLRLKKSRQVFNGMLRRKRPDSYPYDSALSSPSGQALSLSTSSIAMSPNSLALYVSEDDESRSGGILNLVGIPESTPTAPTSRKPTPREDSHRGGRPPKQWPHSGRRLLARFVTAAFPNLIFVQEALRQDGFTVSIRHIESKVREMFGSRKPNDADFDSKLRPKDSAQMDNRVRAFVECKEQWHMLRNRAALELHTFVPSGTTQADIFDIRHDDQQALFVHPQENPPNEAFQAEIQSLSTSRQEYPDPLDRTQTTLLDMGSPFSFVEADIDVSMVEAGGLGKLDLGNPSPLPLGGWRPSSEQGVNDMYPQQSSTVDRPRSPLPWQGRRRGSASSVSSVPVRNNSYTSISRPTGSPTTWQGKYASFDIDFLDTNLSDELFEWPFSPEDKAHEEALSTTFDVPEGNGFTQNPMTNFDNFSHGSLSSSGYEGSSASARERRRARNREAQRLYRQRKTQKSQLDTSNNGEQDHARPPRVFQACERCRRLKSKCTGAKPRCGSCTRLQIECVYVHEAASTRRSGVLDNSEPFPSPYRWHNHSANSSNSSIGASRMSLGRSSQASIFSSFAPSPSVQHPFLASDPGKRKDSTVMSLGGSSGTSIVSSYPASPSLQIKLLSLNPGARKESAIKRYLRSKFNPGSSSNLSTTSLLESRRILKASGAASSDHINLYNICFALSTSSVPGAGNMETIHNPTSPATREPCRVCCEESCLQIECQHEQTPIITAYDHQSWIDANGNTNLHRAVQHGRKTYVAKLLELGADPWAKNREGMNPAVYGWGFLIAHRQDGEKYTNIWVCMLRVLEKQREVAGTAGKAH